MFALKFAFTLCLVALVVAKVQEDKMARYQVASVSNFPFLVQLRSENGDFICGGSIISPSHILTAAECFDSHDYTKVVVVAGASTVSEEGVHRHISKVVKHPAYTSENKKSNAAVVHLSEQLLLENRKIQIVELPEQSVAEDTALYVMGWRHVTPLASNPGNLFVTSLFVADQEHCEKEFNASADINIFCVTGIFDEQFCVGDLGSPVLTHNSKKLVGITSAAHDCKEAKHITSYTNVYNIHSFIEEAMK